MRSPGATSSARSASSRASVPLPTPMTSLTPQYWANSSSKLRTCGPRIYQPPWSTERTAFSKPGSSGALWRDKSLSGMGMKSNANQKRGWGLGIEGRGNRMGDHRMKLSILVPLYNEEEFVAALLERVLAAPLPAGFEREIIVVDDGSSDGSAEIVEDLRRQYPESIRLVRHERNQGKGAAVRTAIRYATGEFTIIQDADLEYDPREEGAVLKPVLEGKADAVYGSRFMISGERRVLYFWHSIANRMLTTACNLVADLNLTDMETCYKAFRTSLLRTIPIRSNRFG